MSQIFIFMDRFSNMWNLKFDPFYLILNSEISSSSDFRKLPFRWDFQDSSNDTTLVLQ